MLRMKTFLSRFLTPLYLSSGLLISCSDIQENSSERTSQKNHDHAGSLSCSSCHQSEYKEWLQSDHFRSMQIANKSNVLGNFNNTSLFSDGVNSTFSKRGQNFVINTEDADGTNSDFEIKFTFGFYPLQQYLVQTYNGRLQATRQSWDSRNKKWFHQYTGKYIYPGDWLHWTGNGQNWNTMCASCHSTGFKKEYNFESDSYSSRYNEINVACESCHGPGTAHIQSINSTSGKDNQDTDPYRLISSKHPGNNFQINTCAPCHARRSQILETTESSNELLDHMIPELISNEFYYADGQIREEDFEYGSFTQSKMYHNKVKCSDCHNPHSGNLVKSGNTLCLNCHDNKYNTETHHFHKGKGASTQCINCHMQERTYMGVDHRRDHSFRIPRPDQSVSYGTPNTCNSCHTTKSNEWAAKIIVQHFGNTRRYHFSDDLIPGSKLTNNSGHHLLKLISDRTQPEIARATALYYISQLHSFTNYDAIISMTSDSSALVRYQAYKTLQQFSPEHWKSSVARGLKDPVRAVRIAAADLFHGVDAMYVPPEYAGSFKTAAREHIAFLQHNRDFALGNVMAGDYYLQDGNYLEAIKHYLRGLKKDSLMNYARINLASAYNGMQKNKEAFATLEQALKIDPMNSNINYHLALLYYETGDFFNSERQFKKALKSKKTNSELYYNYGLFLQHKGKIKEAESIFLEGHSLFNTSPKLNYALSTFYLMQNNFDRARYFARLLHETEPLNQSFQQLYRKFGFI